MPRIPRGQRSTLVEIGYQGVTRDATLAEVPGAWNTVADRWAKVTALSGKEMTDARHHAADVTHKIELDYIAGVDPKKHKVRIGVRTFEIVSAKDPDNRGRDLEIMAVERLGDAAASS